MKTREPGLREIFVDMADVSEDSPPLLFVAPNCISHQDMERFRYRWKQLWRERCDFPRFIVIDGDCQVFQLIRGEWRKLV